MKKSTSPSFSLLKEELNTIINTINDDDLSFEELCTLHEKGLDIIQSLETKIEERQELISKIVK